MECLNCHKIMETCLICLKMKFDFSIWLPFGQPRTICPPSIVWKGDEFGREIKLKDNVRKPVSCSGIKCLICNQIIINYGGGELTSNDKCGSCGGKTENGKLYIFQKLHNISVFWQTNDKGMEEEIKLPSHPKKEAHRCPQCKILIF